MQNLEFVLKSAKIERCGTMHGAAYVHPDTLEVSASKQCKPWWPVRPMGYDPGAGFADRVRLILNPPKLTETPAEVITPPPAEVAAAETVKPKRAPRKKKADPEETPPTT